MRNILLPVMMSLLLLTAGSLPKAVDEFHDPPDGLPENRQIPITKYINPLSTEALLFSSLLSKPTLLSGRMTVPEGFKAFKEPVLETITLSFAGDCTIGDDDKYAWNTFDSVYEEVGDPAYFFRGVQSVFTKDDFTFVNFEGTFTTANKKAVKEYRFKGDPSYVDVLLAGSIEGVTLANNHSLDYLQQGFDDTVAVLEEAGIYWTHFDEYFIVNINGLKIGFLGYKGWEHEQRSNKLLTQQVQALREQGVLYIVANYHWGDQNSYVPNALQKRMAHFAVDNGVDLVIGHHPHVIQGMEVYKGKPILYSLGNFCFGGAPNPRDKDTIIYQMTMIYDPVNQTITDTHDCVIPCRVSGEAGRNNYQPVVATGEEGARILEKFGRISGQIR